MRPLAIAALVSLTACGNAELVIVVPELPEDAAYGALIATDLSGRARGTAFARIESGALRLETNDVFEDGNVLTFVTITEAERAALDVSEAELTGEPVLLASPSDAFFVPSFAAGGAYRPDQTTLEQVPEVPEVSAGWLPACPDLFAGNLAPTLTTNCSRIPCENIVEVNGCEVSIDLSYCERGFGTLSGVIDGRGRIDFGQTERLGQCASVEDLPLAAANIACDGGGVTTPCTLQLYADAPQPFVGAINRLSVVEPAPAWHPHHLGRRSQLGLLTGLVALTDRLVVATSSEWLSEDCSGPQRTTSELAFVDPESMSITATRAAPFCLRHLRPDPIGDGFLGVYRDRSAVPNEDVLGRFSVEGALIQMAPVRDAVIDPRAHTVGVLSILQDPQKTDPSVFIGLAAEAVETPEYVLRYNLRTFEPESQPLLTSARAGGNLVDIVSLDTSSWAFVDAGHDVIQEVTYRGQGLEFIDLKPRCHITGISPGRAYVDNASGRIIFTDTDLDERAAYTMNKADLECHGAAMPVMSTERFRAVTLTRWPNDPSWFLVGGWDPTDTSSTAYAGFYDPSGLRFLAEPIELGQGMVHEATVDARGRVWLTLSDTGELVRLSPK